MHCDDCRRGVDLSRELFWGGEVKMAMEETQVHVHHVDDENLDRQANANLGVWFGLAALTFFSATWLASNVYLRGWSPTKFQLNNALLKDLPYLETLLLIVSGVLIFIAGAFFVKNKWTAFRAALALAVLSFVATAAVQFRMTIWLTGYSPQIRTIDAPSAAIGFLLSATSVVLLAVAGWYTSYGSRRKINQFFPVAVNVWIYTVMFGIIVLFLEDVITVGQFAAWCGLHVTTGQ